jgi:hypothetical protein
MNPSERKTRISQRGRGWEYQDTVRLGARVVQTFNCSGECLKRSLQQRGHSAGLSLAVQATNSSEVWSPNNRSQFEHVLSLINSISTVMAPKFSIRGTPSCDANSAFTSKCSAQQIAGLIYINIAQNFGDSEDAWKATFRRFGSGLFQ